MLSEYSTLFLKINNDVIKATGERMAVNNEMNKIKICWRRWLVFLLTICVGNHTYLSYSRSGSYRKVLYARRQGGHSAKEGRHYL